MLHKTFTDRYERKGKTECIIELLTLQKYDGTNIKEVVFKKHFFSHFFFFFDFLYQSITFTLTYFFDGIIAISSNNINHHYLNDFYLKFISYLSFGCYTKIHFKKPNPRNKSSEYVICEKMH